MLHGISSSTNQQKSFNLKLLSSGLRTYVECNDNGNIYLDGVRKADCTSNMWTSIIDRTTRLIAIQASNDGGRNYIAASVSNGYDTSTQWKCSRKYDSNWAALELDDSGWESAEESDDEAYSARLADVGKIWIGDDTGTVYCRGWMGKDSWTDPTK